MIEWQDKNSGEVVNVPNEDVEEMMRERKGRAVKFKATLSWRMLFIGVAIGGFASTILIAYLTAELKERTRKEEGGHVLERYVRVLNTNLPPYDKKPMTEAELIKWDYDNGVIKIDHGANMVLEVKDGKLVPNREVFEKQEKRVSND